MDSVGTTALHQVETGLQAYDVKARGDMPTLLFHRLYLRVLIREDDQLFPGCGLVVWVPYSPVQGPQPCDRWAMLEKDPGSRNFEGPQTHFTWDHLLAHIPCLGKRFFPSELGIRIASRTGDLGLIPGSGRSLAEENGNPLQYSCLENPMDREALWATVHGVAKSRTRLRDFTFTFMFYARWEFWPEFYFFS